MFIGDKVVSGSFQVFYCDNKESLNVIRKCYIKKVEMLYVVLASLYY